VQLYDGLNKFTEMKPVVVEPDISFVRLTQELLQVRGNQERTLIRDQFLAKLHRKKHHINEKTSADFETATGMTLTAFIDRLRAMPLDGIAAWFTAHPGLSEILDRKNDEPYRAILISEHEDTLRAIERGYGKATKPEDYLKEFSEFIQSRSNTLPALITVLTRPKDLTRKQLRELALELDKAGFSEANLSTAWREMTNQDIAARIVGYIRQAAIGDPLVSFDARVDNALQSILASRSWTTPQRQWLQKIASQTKANQIVDREALDDPDLIFRLEGGGFARLDRMFNGQLQQVLEDFKDALWKPAA
jgi:type I restriction enzyme R subunit